LRVSNRAEAVRILHEAVEHLAGEVVPAAPGVVDPSVLPLDISLGDGPRLQVRVTDAHDRRLARHLPMLVEDATLVADRADDAARRTLQESLDPLTQVAGQGQIPSWLEAAPVGAVICMLDLDNFRDINNTRGHLAGDAVLRRFGAHLLAGTRKNDFVARAGGDEFLLILGDDVGVADAHRRMAQLAASWARSESMRSTVSVGVAAVSDTGPMAAAAAADRAMYRAKRGGVAAVERAGDEDESPALNTLLGATYDAYLTGLAAADAPTAVADLRDALAQGASAKDVVGRVIARGQHTVGESWATGEWGIAEEHAATLAAEQALTLIAPPTPRQPNATRVVIACAEGEWHTMPARLAAELARSPQLEIIVLGGSVPAAELGGSLRVLAPAVLGLSTTLATNLIGASRCIEAARAQGIRVIVGGAAWGPTQLRAQALGASLMLQDLTELARHVREGDLRASVMAPPLPLPAEALTLEHPPSELMEAALEHWAAGRDAEQGDNDHNQTMEAFDWITRHLAAAIACNDPSVVGDLLASQVTSATRQGISIKSVVDVHLALAEALRTTAPRACALLRDQTHHLCSV